MRKEVLTFIKHNLSCHLVWPNAFLSKHADVIMNTGGCTMAYNELFLTGRLQCDADCGVMPFSLSPKPHFFPLKDAPGISSNIIHCYNGDDPWISHPHRAAPSRLQHSAAPSMLGNVQRTALSALLPSSSCEFEKEEPKCQWHPCSTPYQPCNLSPFMTNK